MSEFKSSNFRNEDGSGGPDIVGVTTFTSPYYFVPPSGTTAERPSDPAPGMLRFNEDIGRLEVWRNDHWATILGESPNLGNQLVTNSAGGTGARGVWGGYRNTPTTPSSVSSEYVTISTLGDSQNFGDLTLQRALQASCSSSTRGLFGGGYVYPNSGTGSNRTNKITGWTFSSTGSHVDFGVTLSKTAQNCVGLSNQTRGIFHVGYISAPSTPAGICNILDYVTIASVGNGVDFGDLSDPASEVSSCSSSVRGLFMGGYVAPAPKLRNKIDYVTISTLGDAQDFGDLTQISRASSGGGNSTRGIRMGGVGSPARVNTIDFVTIASTGNAQDFGDLSNTISDAGHNVSSPTRSILAGGYTPAAIDTIQYINNQTTGNSIDFGNLNANKGQLAGASNAHGGL